MASPRPHRFLVIGLGELGRSLAISLSDAGADVIAIDREMRLVDRVKDRVGYAVQGDAREIDVLRAVEAQNVDIAVITVGKDFDATVMAVAALRELGVKQVVARASNPAQRRVLEQLGATRVFSLEVEMGQRLARGFLTPHVADSYEMAKGYDLVHWPAPPALVGQTLAQVDLRKRYNVLVVAIRRAGADGAQVPEPDAVLLAGDLLYVAGRREDISRLSSV